MKEALVDDETAQAVAEMLGVLSDPTRVKIIHALAQASLCVHELGTLLQLGTSAVSHQLRHLRSLRLVRYWKEGRFVCYSLDDDHISHLLGDALEHVREGKGS